MRKACSVLGVARSRRYYQDNPRPKKQDPIPHHKRNIKRLTDAQVNDILALLDANPYSSVDDVFYHALNNGCYIASLRSFYRVAKAHGKLLSQRHGTRRTRPRRARGNNQPPHVEAHRPGQVLCWDITYLPGKYTNQYYACHTAIDLYSRAVVGAVVAHHEDSRVARHMFEEIFAAHPDVDTVHSDNGAAMTSRSLGRLFDAHQVKRSFSRPSISNDNPHMESLFHTMKGMAYYPRAFASIKHAAAWVDEFTTLYNHRPHSGINGYTPQSVLDGTWQQMEANRRSAVEQALADGVITARPKTPIGLPEKVTIIRTTTKTAPMPRALMMHC